MSTTIEELRFFDCNCMIGRYAVPRPESFYSTDHLVEEMDYCGIAEALVYHAWSREYDPAAGNKQLLEEIGKYPQLHGCWVLMPHHTGEMSEPEEVIKEMLTHEIKTIRLFPHASSHQFSLSEWSCGKLFSVLQEHKIPVLIDMEESNWGEIHDLCDRYKEIPFVITNVGYRIDRYIYPLFEKFDNLYIEISGYQLHRGLEAITKRFGAQRLLFGTKMPFYTPGPSIMMVMYSNISDEEKALIAGENLRRLLAGIR